MKLNLGCGFRKKEGFHNVDSFAGCEPDFVFDLTQTPWPWPDGSVDEIHFDFSLEQMGERSRDLFAILKEVHRVARHEAPVKIFYIHPRHDQFVMNPLCVHRLSPEFFMSLSVSQNLAMIGAGQPDMNFALQLGVNFAFKQARPLISEEFNEAFASKQLSNEEIFKRMRYENNICQAVELEMLAVKNASAP